jgi:chromosomal replication initiation ATPase DnaA
MTLPTKEEILQVVANCNGVSMEDIIGKTRKNEIVDARFMYIKFLRKAYKMKKVALAKELNRDHTSIIHALRTFDSRYKHYAYFRDTAEKISQKLKINL